MKLAVLLTCYNRKVKTLNSLEALFISKAKLKNPDDVKLKIFLTDDGCSDGTADAVTDKFGNDIVQIISSDGNAYWAGGMRLAWNAALKHSWEFDFYLLLNDDTMISETGLHELLQTDDYSLEKYNRHCVCTGFIAAPDNYSLITYGAKIYKNSLLKGAVDLQPCGIPQTCTMPNANLLLVHRDVVNEIGVLDSSFVHGAADWDYGIRASKANFPVLTTSNVCGYCEFDHDKGDIEETKVRLMTISARKLFLNRPTHIYKDGLTFNKRYFRFKYYLMKFAYYLNLYIPSIYYVIFKKRGH